jgi:hypothetical protein
MMVNGSRRMSGQPSDPASQVIVGCKPEDWCFAKDCRCKPDVTNKKPLGIAPSCSEMGITCESGELRPTPWTSSAQARLKLAVECTGSEDRKSSLQSGTRPGFHKEWARGRQEGRGSWAASPSAIDPTRNIGHPLGLNSTLWRQKPQTSQLTKFSRDQFGSG